MIMMVSCWKFLQLLVFIWRILGPQPCVLMLDVRRSMIGCHYSGRAGKKWKTVEGLVGENVGGS